MIKSITLELLQEIMKLDEKHRLKEGLNASLTILNMLMHELHSNENRLTVWEGFGQMMAMTSPVIISSKKT